MRAAALEHLRVADPDSLQQVTPDGVASGEILIRGNTVMMGYLKNPGATSKAFEGGWFHTGDVAVVQSEVPCAFVELKPNAPEITEADVISFCRERLAHFKCPRHVVFVELPKTATGKIQ